MGRGQLGVAYVDRAPAGRRPREIIEEFSAALAAGLAQLGVTAAFHGKNDLETGGRKIAGLGLYLDPAGAMLFHASVLADLDVELMLEVLRVPAAKLAGQGHRRRHRAGHHGLGRDRPPPRCHHGPARHRRRVRRHLRGRLEPGSPDRAEQVQALALALDRYRSPSWLERADHGGRRQRVGPAQGAHGAGPDPYHDPRRPGQERHRGRGLQRTGARSRGPGVGVALAAPGRAGSVAAVVAGSGAAGALGVPAERVVAAVLEAGRQAGRRSAARAQLQATAL